MKKQFKKQAASIMIASMVLTGGTVSAETIYEPLQPTPELISAKLQDGEYSVLVNDLTMATAAFSNDDHEIMVPLREAAQALGFTVTWHQDKQWAEVSLEGSPIWTLVQPGLNQYAYNRMNVELSAAPVKLANRLYVPAQFFSEILRSHVSVEGTQVSISRQVEEAKTQTQQAVITKINNEENYTSLQVNGVGLEGFILNIDENTVIRNAAGEQIKLDQLTLGLRIEVKHSLAMTMSLPGQTYAYEITALEDAGQEMLGTSGSIVEVLEGNNGESRFLIEGEAMSKYSQEKVALMHYEDTIITDLQGNPVELEQLTKGAKVFAYYGSELTKSIPPIGLAWKLVYLGE